MIRWDQEQHQIATTTGDTYRAPAKASDGLGLREPGTIAHSTPGWVLLTRNLEVATIDSADRDEQSASPVVPPPQFRHQMSPDISSRAWGTRDTAGDRRERDQIRVPRW